MSLAMSRLSSSGCERDWDELPQPDMPLTVGIDGGCVNPCEQRRKKDGRFEVIVGKSMAAEGESKCFVLVNSYVRVRRSCE
jgi:hypothetical protein